MLSRRHYYPFPFEAQSCLCYIFFRNIWSSLLLSLVLDQTWKWIALPNPTFRVPLELKYPQATNTCGNTLNIFLVAFQRVLLDSEGWLSHCCYWGRSERLASLEEGRPWVSFWSLCFFTPDINIAQGGHGQCWHQGVQGGCRHDHHERRLCYNRQWSRRRAG